MGRSSRALGLSIVVGLLWTLGLLAATGGLAQSAGGSFTGIVTDEAETPLAGITVALYHRSSAPDEPPVWQDFYTVTGVDGRFRFDNMPDGLYRLAAEHYNFPNPPDYDSEFYDNKSAFWEADDINFVNSGAVDEFVIRLRAKARITGAVYSEAGAPLSGIRAVAYVYEANGDYYRETAGTFRSDATGHYTISGLLEGVYRVRFQDDLTRFYRTEFYDNAPDLDSGTDISVAASSLITGIDARLAATGGITGVVTDGNGFPVELISVAVHRLVDAQNQPPYWAQIAGGESGANGMYAVYGLESGVYRILFHDLRNPPLYSPQYYSNSAAIETATDISVTEGLITSDVNAQIAGTGSIGGRITGFRGEPVSGARVSALRGERQSDGTIQYSLDELTNTDGNGLYRITNLVSGLYIIHAEPGQNPFVYLEQFYLDAATIEAATPITLAGGQDVDGIDQQLPPAQRIAGRVFGPEGQPLHHICPTLWHIGANGQWQKFPLVSQIATNLHGEYRFGVIPNGSYRLEFEDCFPRGIYAAEFYDDVDELAQATVLELKPKGYFHDVNPQLGPRSHITGRVTDLQGQPIPAISVTALRLETEGPSAGDWLGAGETSTDANGLYAIDRLERGRYRLYFTDSRRPALYLDEYFDNAFALEDATEIAVGRSVVMSDLNVVLTNGGSITGVVTNAAGQPVAGVIASAWRERQSPSGGWEIVSWAETDANGRYAIRYLKPGIHRVLFDDFEQGRYSPQYYKNVPLIELGDDVQVERDSVTGDINAQLSRAASVAGKVTDPNGQPAAGVIVAAYQWISDTAQGNPWAPVRYAESNAKGEFFLGGLIEGHFRVGFAVTDFQLDGAYVTEYYDDVSEFDQAVDLLLAGGQQLRGINASLAFRPRIQGRVTDEVGDPLSDIVVTLYAQLPSGFDGSIIRGFGSSDEQGNYTFSNLLPGIYRVGFGDSTTPPAFRSEFWENVRHFAQATSITATAGAVITGIDARLASFAVNTPPIAHSDVLTAEQGQVVLFPSVLLNDEDADDDPLSVVFETHPAHGSLSFVGDGQMSYTHNGSANGHDFFTYRAADGVSQSNIATATITIQLRPLIPLFLPFLSGTSDIPPATER